MINYPLEKKDFQWRDTLNFNIGMKFRINDADKLSLTALNQREQSAFLNDDENSTLNIFFFCVTA